MNIWIFNHYAVGPKSSGFTRHYDFAKKLKKKGVKVTIFAASFNYQTKKEEIEYKNSWFKIEEIDGVRFVWIKTIPYIKNNYKRVINMFEYSIKAYLLKNKVDDKPTHIIGSLMHPFAAITGLLVSKRKGTYFIFEERDLWPQSMIDLGGASENGLKVKLLRKIESWLINSSDKIILLFDKAIQYMNNKNVPSDKIIVISNGVDLERYYENIELQLPNYLEEVLNLHQDKYIAVYTGAHGMANNLDLVLDVAKDISNIDKKIHFILLGDGVHKEKLINRKQDEAINNVTFLDSINKEYIPAFLKRVNVGLLPLHNSPVFNWGISPNKMYDYMAAKLPVLIVTDIEKDALNKENPSILISRKQRENLAKELLSLSKDKKRGEALGEQGYNYVNTECSWEYLADKFLNEFSNEKY